MAMKLNKKILFLTPITLTAIIFLSMFFLKIYFSFSFDEKELKQTINHICREKLDKAVKFDDIYIDFKGDIILNNFNISMTNDFNDNISLLQARKAVFRIRFADLFKEKIIIKGIEFIDPAVNLHKKYGKSYCENFQKLKGLIHKLREIDSIDSDNFIIYFNNSILTYHEVFKNSDLIFQANKISCTIELKQEKISYSLQGEIKPSATKEIKFGTIRLSGCVYENKKEISDNKILIENFDLSYLNEIFKNYNLCSLSMNGGLSTELLLRRETGGLAFSGIIRTNNLNLVSQTESPYSLYSNGNLNIDIDGLFSSKYRKLLIEKLRIKDDMLDIYAVGEYNDSNSKKNIRINIKSSDIDLSELSGYFTPVNDISYSGVLGFSTDIHYDFKQNSAFRMNSEVNIENFSVSHYTGKGNEKLLKNLNGNISLKKNELLVKMNLNTPDSDFVINSRTDIKKWIPLTSATEFNMQSSAVSFGLLTSLTGRFVNYLVDEGYRDLKKGYDELFFLKKPVGQLTINNDFLFKYSASRLNFGEKADLSNFLLKAEMKKGFLQVREFNLQGYGASYSMEMESFMNRDYPHLSANLRINGFDLENFSDDLKSEIKFGGKAAFDLSYELNFYRIAHVVQNAKAQMKLNVYNGYLRNSTFQSRLMNYLMKSGYEDINLENIEFSNFNITVNEMGEYFTFSPLSVSSPQIDFNSFGRYNYNDGISMTVFATLRDKNRRTVRIPFSISGPLTSPVAKILYRKEAGQFSFFNIN